MAARIVSEITHTAPGDRAGGFDAEAALKDWAEAQLDVFTAGLGQVAAAQQAVFSFWLGAAEASARAWPGAGAFGPIAPLSPAFLEAWSPWLPFVQRGGEQLG